MRFVCKICNTNNYQHVYRITRYNLYRCLNCQIVFVRPQPNLKKLEANNVEKYNTEENEKVYLSMQNIFKDRADKCIKILRQLRNGGKLLDIGCSYGFYLDAFRKNGYKAEGLEVSDRAIKYARNILNLKVIDGTLDNRSFKKEEFDVVTLFDVLEHFPDPQKSISQIRKIIKKGGIVIIQTPNYDSLISRLTSTKWFWLLIPQHLFLYSINTLKYFLKNNGFKVLRVSTWDDYHEFVSNLLSLVGINYWGKTSFLHRILVKFKYPLRPLSYLWNIFFLGGEILVYAQKE